MSLNKKKAEKDIFEMLPQAVASFKKKMIAPFIGEAKDKYINERPPLRAELFTEEQLKLHARAISQKHELISRHPSEQLLKRLAENENILIEVHKKLTDLVGRNERIVPAAEWLLDNFYLIEEQIYIGKKHLPKGYSKGLPQLAKGELAGMPRIYDIAVEIISHSDGHINLNNLTSFINAYQTNTFLKIGELWALPIMLRLSLLENLRRISIQIFIDLINKSLAGEWADKLISTAEKNPKNLVLIIADMARSEPPMESSFVAELTRRLLEKGNNLSLPVSWLEQQLAEYGLTTEELIQQDNKKQAADQVSISNSISSLRFLESTDWRDFVESTSVVEKILQEDINGVYKRMDFYTRDKYRHAIEKIAKRSKLTEEAVAGLAVDEARSAINNPNARLAHVGYYLLDKGIHKIHKKAGIKLSVFDKCYNLCHRNSLFFYITGILLLTSVFSLSLASKAYHEGLTGYKLLLMVVVCLFATSQLALSIINWLATLLAKPSVLPKMDFSKGITDEHRTMVVIPTLINTISGIKELVENLEVRFLANRDANLYFALLTDFKDADQETLAEDSMLLQQLSNKITALNTKYGRTSNDTFFLFHRPRKWNGPEKKWMGYERKRGKLSDLNKLISGNSENDFLKIIGEKKIYRSVKYIITLDTDTQLPRDAAKKMTGTLAHPLNRPVFSKTKQRIVDGYTILQPRVSNSLPGDESSLYGKIHGNEPGTDPYTRAVSDVYQDLFAEGSFIGKGIYDVAAFENTLGDKFPENQILSHDLLEGCYTRSGLISDVQLYEEYPFRYLEDMQRRHRWIRGDWQIIGWLLPFTKWADKKLHRNHISTLSRWKIFDNIRRSFVPICLMLLLTYALLFSPLPWYWATAVISIMLLPTLLGLLWESFHKSEDVAFAQHLNYTFTASKDRFIKFFVDFATLPYEAYFTTDAIMRTFWRIFISRKNLLQWNPYQNQKNQKSIFQFYKTIWFAPVYAVTLLITLIILSPVTLIIVFPLLILWFISPLVAWHISRPALNKKENLTAGQERNLRMLARKTWSFFETFVTAQDNWLPPDNYQEQPVERTAHRTSPTNIGMALLANLTAFDFGYITAGQLIERSSNTIATLQKMEKYRGHLFNWYDTETLAPLAPKYVSTVDSGNLAGHLITLKQGLYTIADKKITDNSFFEGLIDILHIIKEKAAASDAADTVNDFIEKVSENYPQATGSLTLCKKFIDEIHSSFAQFLESTGFNLPEEANWWAQKAMAHIIFAKNQLASLCPWLLLTEPPEKFAALIPILPSIPSIRQLSKIEEILLQRMNDFNASEISSEEKAWLNNFIRIVSESARRAKVIILTLDQLALKCNDLADIEFDFLYYPTQHLFTIGYNVDEQRKDNGLYDLLASEARLTTFVAISQGKLPQDSWFALGRQLTNVGSMPMLLSWSGSMFEYLMPLLVMPVYENTLLNNTYKAIVQKQIEYGRKRNVPWGISESGYSLTDGQLNYQYKAFGVPGTGFKRGLGEDLVISPYSTMMALMVEPALAYDNLEILKEAGFEGKYGFYEAIDYTTARLQRKQSFTVIKSFMAHHQGMGFLSLAYLLLNKPMQQRFAADLGVKSALLLLQERIPRISSFYSPALHAADSALIYGNDIPMRVIKNPNTLTPEVQLLSNGRYHVMVTNSGSGYSRWKNLAVTRWREDGTCDNSGSFCYIREVNNDTCWSVGYQPTLQSSNNYEAVFSQGRAEFRRSDFSLDTHTEIVVSPEDDIELRRIHIANRSRKKRIIEITSYAEVVLAPQMAEEMHPAFSNLFVDTAIDKKRNAIICTRRPRTANEQVPWMFQLMKVTDAEILKVSYETNREKFTGRGYSIQNPKAMQSDAVLQGQSGAVLDPVVVMRYRIVIEPLASANIDVIMGISDTENHCNFLIDKYQDHQLTNRVLELAWTHSQVVLRQLNATEPDAQLYARIAGSVIFANDSLRADASVIVKNHRNQSGLWGYSISGDLPIVLLQIEDPANIQLVKQMIQAHNYWRMKGLIVDLVIWNEDNGGYRQVLQNDILSLVTSGRSADVKDQPGGIFIRSSEQVSNEDRILFQSVARVIISDRFGTLEEQIMRRNKIKTQVPYFSPTKFHASIFTTVTPPAGLQFFNGMGGFSANGKEYVIITTPQQTTPLPWSNILANPHFGSIVTESGQAYTWMDNAHEYRLTPWNNDPVTDMQGEAFYLRDEESGRFWSPSSFPCRGASPYVTRHGFGYTVYEHSEDGIDSAMTVFTDIESPVKYIVIKLNNKSQRARQLSATGYTEWILGDLKTKTQMHVVTDVDSHTGAIIAYNKYSSEFSNKVAFFDADNVNRTITADRTEFIGRNGTLANPDGMYRARFSGLTGAALDPCAVIQVMIDLAEGQEKEIIFRLGAGENMQDTLNTIKKVSGKENASIAFDKVQHFWQQTLHAVQVYTPDAAFNILVNGWLNYQTIASRIWARSGFYQSGGAFGFRDQLQDVLSLIHSRPAMVKNQILLCASRQFKEGDVQHWWHPPLGRGVRTTCSDDLLWLPFVTIKYVTATADKTILEEQIHFLEGRLLNTGEESYYDLPIRSEKTATLYDHCVLAIEHALRFGKHGLPLIGSGDWNDGMDKVGTEGKGESVWLAFFIYEILTKFREVALLKNDNTFAEKCKTVAAELSKNIYEHAWDGAWYRRAYFDDGTPLGSAENEECKIDSIAQSWSVLSGAADDERRLMAMNAAEKYLVRKEEGIIQLFDPPFDKSALNPGYIKGYVPGVRENGGQYTHAAVWLIMAFAALGDAEKTWELIQLINPLNHGKDDATINTYKAEPYVMAADVYTVPLHRGRGGWTWYTGAAGWFYQLLTESFAGLRREGDKLFINPCLPAAWNEVKIKYSYENTVYNITAERALPDKVSEIWIDGKKQTENFISLKNDEKEHEVKIVFSTNKAGKI